MVSSSTEHRPIKVAAPLELRRNGQAELLAGDGSNYNKLCPLPGHDEEATVAAPQQSDPCVTTTVNAVESQVEVLRKDAVGRAEDRFEHDTIRAVLEETEEWQLPVVCTEAAVEPGVSDGASSPPADGGGMGQGGGLQRETEEDLPQEIIILKRRGQRLRRASTAAATTAAGHSGSLLTRVDMGTEARAAPESHSVARVNLGTEAVGHSVAVVTQVDLGMGMEAWAAAAGHSLARLTRGAIWMEARARATASGVLGRAHLAGGKT
ncbi:unnamed protein product [Triticum turgidum subsp. durum]|uniref:Uncharacterized protein n=1 Tax=Triticum turgidum subsp. durum TaxID=4567 RepID=A0A9R1Q7S3_TRITD|nr:unnamed protein product [Triticum turgidum subsp. durum]